jgi:hypothetical protein
MTKHECRMPKEWRKRGERTENREQKLDVRRQITPQSGSPHHHFFDKAARILIKKMNSRILMKRLSKTSSLSTILTLAIFLILPSRVSAFLPGTVPVAPGNTVIPGDATGQVAGTLLASLSTPFTTNLGTTSGTLLSAVFIEPGGTLDFYYQIVNSALSRDGIARETDTDFFPFLTQVGFRLDGASLTGSSFSNGTTLPVSADLGLGGDAVGFNFTPPLLAEVLPGQTSAVLVISTNATNFTTGNMSVIDGGVFSTAAFQPIPEPESIALLVCGSVILGLVRRRVR